MKKIYLSLVIVLSILISLAICFYIGENWFFDKLFYRKSAIHGYYNRFYFDPEKNQHNWINTIITNWREQDLLKLVDGFIWPPPRLGEKTIAIIGDSYTYGIGVLPWERFSNKLQSQLNKNGVNNRVLNFSEPGNSIIDNFVLYQLIKDQVKPDLIIISLVSNDLFLSPPRYPLGESTIQKLDDVCQQPIYEIPDYDQTSDREFFQIAINSFSLEWRNRCYLDQIAKIIGTDSSVVFYSFSQGELVPSCNNRPVSEEWLLITEYASTFARYGNAIFMHPDDTIKDKQVSAKEAHSSRKMHQIYAEELAAFILPKLQIK